MQFLWNFVTDFGDTAVTLPLAAVTIAFLFFSGWPRAALTFALVLAGCGAAIGLVKLVLQSCGRPLLHIDVANPSGHAAISAMVYGALAVLFSRNILDRYRWLPILAAAALVSAIALSRVVLDSHSPVEVAIGLSIGVMGAVAFWYLLPVLPAGPFRGLWLAAIALIVVGAMHGSRWPIEAVIRGIVHFIRHSVPSCA